MSRLGAAFGGEKSRYPLLLEGAMDLVICRTGETVVPSGLADRKFAMFDAAKHLVFELKKIQRIEEIVIEEGLSLDTIWVRVQKPLVLED